MTKKVLKVLEYLICVRNSRPPFMVIANLLNSRYMAVGAFRDNAKKMAA